MNVNVRFTLRVQGPRVLFSIRRGVGGGGVGVVEGLGEEFEEVRAPGPEEVRLCVETVFEDVVRLLDLS